MAYQTQKPAKALITDATGTAVSFPVVAPVTLDDLDVEAITIPVGTPIGVYKTYDTSEYSSVRLQIDSGSNIDIRCKFNETGTGNPGNGPIMNLSKPVSAPLSSTQGATSAPSVWVVPVLGSRMQLYVNAIPTADIVMSVCLSRKAAPKPMGGRVSKMITTGTSGNLLNSGATVIGWELLNTSAAARYLHLYSAQGNPTIGSTTIVHTIPIPAGQAARLDTQFGWYLSSGIAWAITTDAAGSSVASSGDVVGSVGYML